MRGAKTRYPTTSVKGVCHHCSLRRRWYHSWRCPVSPATDPVSLHHRFRDSHHPSDRPVSAVVGLGPSVAAQRDAGTAAVATGSAGATGATGAIATGAATTFATTTCVAAATGAVATRTGAVAPPSP